MTPVVHLQGCLLHSHALHTFFQGMVECHAGGVEVLVIDTIDEDEVAEDVFFNFGAVCATDNIIKINEPFYIFRVHPASASHTSERFQKNIRCLQVLVAYIEEKLAPLNDVNFVRQVENYWLLHISGNYILPFVNEKNSACLQILMHSYFQGILAVQENQQLKYKLEKIEQILKV